MHTCIARGWGHKPSGLNIRKGECLPRKMRVCYLREGTWKDCRCPLESSMPNPMAACSASGHPALGRAFLVTTKCHLLRRPFWHQPSLPKGLASLQRPAEVLSLKDSHGHLAISYMIRVQVSSLSWLFVSEPTPGFVQPTNLNTDSRGLCPKHKGSAYLDIIWIYIITAWDCISFSDNHITLCWLTDLFVNQNSKGLFISFIPEQMRTESQIIYLWSLRICLLRFDYFLQSVRIFFACVCGHPQ